MNSVTKILALVSMQLLVAMTTVPTKALAHHFFATEYERESRGTIRGIVEEVSFANPHVRLNVAVRDETGQIQIWAANTVGPNSLAHRGWTSDTIKRGETITVEGFLGRDGAHRVWIQMLESENGSVIYPVGRQTAPSETP
jgi:hypothetical protein